MSEEIKKCCMLKTFLKARDEEGKVFTSGLCERDKEAQFRMCARVCVCMCVQKALNQGDDYSRVLGHPVGGASLDRRKEKGGRGEGPQIESLTPPQYGGEEGVRGSVKQYRDHLTGPARILHKGQQGIERQS